MRKIVFLGLLFLGTSLLLAHPHFRKTLTLQLPNGVEATLVYQTTSANESLASDAQVGAFISPRGPRLTLSGEVAAGGAVIPAGEYTIGVIKNGDKDWTMALYPGGLRRGDTPDMSKVVKLDSLFSDAEGLAPHMIIDINPGHGKFEGKPVLMIQFGHLTLDGLIG